MPRVKDEDRKRAKRPKTRTGCRTCKIRKVKCDEAKPECRRCTSTGRRCDGYQYPCDPEPLMNGEQQIGLFVDTYSGVFESAKEKRAFQFFKERTSPRITGLSEFDFWNRTILQAIFTEPSIRCAVLAFGSLHEGFEKTGNVTHFEDEFALRQYNAAIRYHLANIAGLEADPDRIDSYVASCIIFVSIEILQGHYQSALSLVKGAVKLFYQCNESLGRCSAYPLESLENLLSRLQSQAVGLIGFESIGLTVPPRLRAAGFIAMPDSFVNVAQAKEFIEFYSYTHALSRNGHEMPKTAQPNTTDFQLYLQILMAWSQAFENLIVEQEATFTEMELQTANILRIWQTMTAAGIAMHLEFEATVDDQTLWDHFEESSRQVVALAEQVLKFTHGTPIDCSSTHKEPLHQFTLDIGIVAPLYDTARVCRDPLVRRKAINLLRQYPCREGLWDSLLAARAAERQMEIEESAVDEVRCAADIPGWARVTTVLPTFHLGERWCEVEFKRTKFVSNLPEEWVCRREVFEW